MEYTDFTQMTDLSVRDVFESEVQTEMDQLLSSEAARFTPQPEDADVVELQCADMHDDTVNASLWPTVTLPDPIITTMEGTTSTNSITTTSTTNTIDLSQFTSPDKYSLDGNSLLVDPQTGLPVNAFQLTSNGNNAAQQQLNLIVSAADSNGQTIQQQIPVSLNLGNINMNLSSQDQGLYTNSALLTVTAQQQQRQQQQQQQSTANLQQLTFQSAAATLQGLQAAFTQVPLQNQNLQTTTTSQSHHAKVMKVEPTNKNGLVAEKVWAKPAYSYSCLITMALKNSKTGCLPVSEIYQFMCENFPYFKTAPDGWKNSVRHNLSLNKCFAKIEKPQTSNTGARKGCLWALNPEKTAKMEEEVAKWTKKDPAGIRRAMANPDELERIEAAVNGTRHSLPSNIHLQTQPLQRIEPKVTPTTATTTRTTPKIEPKITISDDFGSGGGGNQINADIFSADINMPLDPAGLVTFEGDFNLQDQLGLDPLTCSDIMNLDIPITSAFTTTTSLPSNPVMSSFLDASPIKDPSSLGNLAGLDAQQYAQSQFCSPSRTSVTALM